MTILNDIVKNTKAKLVEKKAAVSLDEIKYAYFDLDQGKEVLTQNYENLNIEEIIDTITNILNY